MSKKDTVSQPIIGISASLLTIESGCFMGRERAFVGDDYVKAIEQAGGISIVLPIVESDETMRRHIDLIDGLLLSGGQDVNPHHYGEEPSQLLGAVSLKRDAYELGLVRHSHAMKKPILGVCRGLQLMNVAFGGSLYQDIPHAIPEALQHHQIAHPEDATQKIDLVEGSLMQRIMGTTQIVANTYHHQAIKLLAPGFSVNARAQDGVIEGIEKDGDLFTLGVQWHPELMYMNHSTMVRLFQAFVEAARAVQRGQG